MQSFFLAEPPRRRSAGNGGPLGYPPTILCSGCETGSGALMRTGKAAQTGFALHPRRTQFAELFSEVLLFHFIVCFITPPAPDYIDLAGWCVQNVCAVVFYSKFGDPGGVEVGLSVYLLGGGLPLFLV